MLVQGQDAWGARPVSPGRTIEPEFPAERQAQANAKLVVTLSLHHACHLALAPGFSRDRIGLYLLVGTQSQPSQMAPVSTHPHLSL